MTSEKSKKAEEFRSLRIRLGYSQPEFAKLLDVSRAAIARAEAVHPSRLVMTRLENAKLKGLLVPRPEK